MVTSIMNCPECHKPLPEKRNALMVRHPVCSRRYFSRKQREKERRVVVPIIEEAVILPSPLLGREATLEERLEKLEAKVKDFNERLVRFQAEWNQHRLHHDQVTLPQRGAIR